jgi:hypothetical protein
LAQDRPS